MIGVEAGEKKPEPVSAGEEDPVVESDDNSPLLN